MTITLHGLSKQQRALADIVWAMDTVEQLHAFRNSLRGQQQRDLDTVLTLILMAEIDAQVEESGDYSLAAAVIDSVK